MCINRIFKCCEQLLTPRPSRSNTHLEESAGSCARVAKKFTKTIINTEAIENLFTLASYSTISFLLDCGEGLRT
jgi:hypothetical protein